jgi:hypothetical protein
MENFQQFSYRVERGLYVLYQGEERQRPPDATVTLAFDKEQGLLKHGGFQWVQRWAQQQKERLRGSGSAFERLADNLVVITGRLPVDELNRCLANSQYICELYPRIRAGEVKPLPAPTEAAVAASEPVVSKQKATAVHLELAAAY